MSGSLSWQKCPTPGISVSRARGQTRSFRCRATFAGDTASASPQQMCTGSFTRESDGSQRDFSKRLRSVRYWITRWFIRCPCCSWTLAHISPASSAVSRSLPCALCTVRLKALQLANRRLNSGPAAPRTSIQTRWYQIDFLSPWLKRITLLWAKVANECLKRTGDEGRAVREANAVV